MKRTRLSLPVLLLFSCLFASPGTSQEELFVDAIDVDLVTVDVLVKDRGGKPVLDLDRQDFEVFEDGKPVAIQTFRPAQAPIEFAQPSRSAVRELRRREERGEIVEPAHFVVFLDWLHSGANGFKNVLEALANALSWLPPEDEVMVVSFDGGIHVELPFSTDREALRDKLGQLVGSRGSMMAEMEKRRVWKELETLVRHQMSLAGQVECYELGHLVESSLGRISGRIEASAYALEILAQSLAGFDGKKVVLHVSDGVPTVPAGPEYQWAIEMCDGTALAMGVPGARQVTAEDGWDPGAARMTALGYDSSPEWQRAGAVASSYDVAIYPVQASGLRGSSVGVETSLQKTVSVRMLEKSNLEDSLVILAHETGGTAILNTNDFAPGLQGMLVSTRASYVLGYAPPTPRDGKVHKIEVKVARKGVTVRHRASYRAVERDQDVAARLISTLLYGQSENPLRIRATAQSPTDARTVVRIAIPLDAITFLPDANEASRQGVVTAFVVAQDAKGRSTDVRQNTVPIVVDPDSEETDFIYDVRMDVVSSDHEFAVAVRDDVGGTTSWLKLSDR